jgi:7-cyano-7-deazaguanine synthase in queuosine biosynthesis
MTGDREYRFTFQPGHRTPRATLFDTAEEGVQPRDNASIVLFSGGVDSLTGTLARLRNTQDQVCLISHRSGQPGTARTQDRLAEALEREYPGRVQHFKFHCGLRGVRADEETQRTRAFLYTSIAYALARAFSAPSFYIYENGVTALNLAKRQDLMNARASRTTHPKTVALLRQYLGQVAESPVDLLTPFAWHTKADVFLELAQLGGTHLLPSSVSCGKTFRKAGQATHCGGCSQCIDRRFAAYAAGLDEIDHAGLYTTDIIRQQMEDGEVVTGIIDFLRQGRGFAVSNADSFYHDKLAELADIVDYLPGTEEDAVQKVWELCHRHGSQVMAAAKRIREVHEDLRYAVPKGSVLDVVSNREYLRPAVERLVETICDRMRKAIPLAFQKNPPKDEPDFNDKVSAIVNTDKDELEREHPAISFALARAIPDHSKPGHDLLIESKYIRASMPLSKATEGMAADLTKYPETSHVLFLVYDPGRAISDDDKFRRDFERSGRCTVCILR